MSTRVQKGFTLSEFLIGLVIVGLAAVLVLPNILNSGSGHRQEISQGIKNDVLKAFELASSKGLIQKSDSPSTFVSKALKLSKINETTDTVNFKMQTDWKIAVPKRWSTPSDPKLPDYAISTITSPDGGFTENISIYRDNDAPSSSTLAQAEPVVITGPATPEGTGPGGNPIINANPPAVNNNPIDELTGDVSFRFVDSTTLLPIPMSTYTLEVNCPSSSLTSTIHTLSFANVMPNLSCTVSPLSLDSAYEAASANPIAFTTTSNTIVVDIPVRLAPVITAKTISVKFISSGADVTNTILTHTGSMTCSTSGGASQSFSLNSTLVASNIPSVNWNCSVRFTVLSDGTIPYSQVTNPFSFDLRPKQPTDSISINIQPDFSTGITTVNLMERDANRNMSHNYYNDCADTRLQYFSTLYGGNSTQIRLSDGRNGVLGCAGVGNSKWSSIYNMSMNSSVSYLFDMNGNVVDTARAGIGDDPSVLIRTTNFYLPDGSPAINVADGTEDPILMQTINRYPQYRNNYLAAYGAAYWVTQQTHPELTTKEAIQTYIRAHYYNTTHGNNPGYMINAVLSTYNVMHPDAPVKMLYTNPANNRKYMVNVAMYRMSPVKIGLNGVDAIASDNGAFTIDVDGFNAHKIPVMQTTGGLAKNEAWLVLDRGRSGFTFNKTVDGDDVFGDHSGQFVSGYEDLGIAFKDSILTDSMGIKYIKLTPEPWYEYLWRQIQKLLGFKVAPNAYSDLKLLTSDNHVLDANQYIDRADVSYRNVKEFSPSGKNAIFQRAAVYYKNGHKAQSGDYWFAPKFYFKFMPIEDKNKN